MATAVFFHAHPDDESIATGGVMAMAAAAGHRVILVCATDGAHGEPTAGSVPAGSTLGDVRLAELEESARILGAARVEWLGYGDSGMDQKSTNDHPDCFWQADRDAAARRLATILRAESADLLTVYDANGGYGHPDHIQVHRVGHRAASLAETPHVFESTMNREQMKSFGEDPAWAEMAEDTDRSADELEAERNEFLEQDLGTPAADITHAVDVTGVVAEKKAAMAAHASQITEDSIFLTLPDDAFAMAFGQEWYVHYGSSQQGAPYLDDIYAVLD